MPSPEQSLFQPREFLAPDSGTEGLPGLQGTQNSQRPEQRRENLPTPSLSQKDAPLDDSYMLDEQEPKEHDSDEVSAVGPLAHPLAATATLREGQGMMGEGTINVFSAVDRQEPATQDHAPESLPDEDTGAAQPAQGDLFFDYSKLRPKRITRGQAEEFCHYWLEFKRRLGNPDTQRERTTQEDWDQYYAELARHEETLKQHLPEILRQWEVVERVQKSYPSLWRRVLKHYLML